MNVIAHFKAKGKPRTWDGGSATKFWVDIDKGSKYPSVGEFEVFGDKFDLDQLSEGDKIDIHFNIKGRKTEYKGKPMFFQTLQAWKIEKVDGGSAPAPDDEGDSDLPF